MSAVSDSLDESGPLSALRPYRGAIIGLAVGLLALGLLFHMEVMVALRIWIDSTAYNHCFLVIPIAGFLIWDRRHELIGLPATPFPLAALAAIPVTAAWLVAERLGIMEGRQLMAVTLLEILFLSVLGWRLFLAVLGPLLYLYFLVPFGEFLVPRLQDVTTVFVRHGLDFLHIPAYIDGYTIEIAEGNFYVAEACAGLRFLIASIAFGVLYALMMYRSPVRRGVFMAVSIVVPVIANGFRALGIVVLGHVIGSAEAAAADHVIYGWVFFSAVILLLIVLGLPFREDEAPSDRKPVRRTIMPDGAVRPAIVAAVCVVLAASISPGIAGALDLKGAGAILAPAPLAQIEGCVSAPSPAIDTSAATGRMAAERVTCGSAVFDVRTEIFSSHTTAGPVLAERRRLNRVPNAEDVLEDWLTPDSSSPARAWRMVRSREPAFAGAAGVWVDGEPSRLGMPMRMRLAWTSLAGAAVPPVLVTVTPVLQWDKLSIEGQHRAEAVLVEFLRANPNLGGQAGTPQ